MSEKAVRPILTAGMQVLAKDFTGDWFPATILRVDNLKKKAKVHYEDYDASFDVYISFDWIKPLNSPQVAKRPAASQAVQKKASASSNVVNITLPAHLDERVASAAKHNSQAEDPIVRSVHKVLVQQQSKKQLALSRALSAAKMEVKEDPLGDDPKIEDFLGRKVKKYFRGYGIFEGIVTSINKKEQTGSVTFSDGDVENMSLRTLTLLYKNPPVDKRGSASPNKATRAKSFEEVAMRVAAAGLAGHGHTEEEDEEEDKSGPGGEEGEADEAGNDKTAQQQTEDGEAVSTSADAPSGEEGGAGDANAPAAKKSRKSDGKDEANDDVAALRKEVESLRRRCRTLMLEKEQAEKEAKKAIERSVELEQRHVAAVKIFDLLQKTLTPS